MSDRTLLFRGIVKNGVIVPPPGMELLEGATFELKPLDLPMQFTDEELAEFEGWERLGDEAWAMIDWGEGELARESG